MVDSIWYGVYGIYSVPQETKVQPIFQKDQIRNPRKFEVLPLAFMSFQADGSIKNYKLK